MDLKLFGAKFIVDIQGIREFFRDNYNIIDEDVVDIPFACVLSHALPGMPVWLMIIGPPSSGKTEFLRSLGETTTPYVLPISKLTKKAILSGRPVSEKNPEPDIALKMDNKITTIQDMTGLFADVGTLKSILGDLRDVYDGYITVHYPGGVKQIRIYTTLLMAVTGIIDKHRLWAVQMGERNIYMRIPPFSVQEERKWKEKMKQSTKTLEEMQDEAKDLMSDFLTSLFIFKDILKHENILLREMLDDNISDNLYDLSQLIGLLRSSVVKRDKGTIVDISQREGPYRLHIQLIKIMICLSFIKMKNVTDKKLQVSIVRLALDCIPYTRFIAFLPFLKLYQDMKESRSGVGSGVGDVWGNVSTKMLRNDKIIDFCETTFEFMHKYAIVNSLDDLEALKIIKRVDIEDDRFFYWALTKKFINDFRQILDFIVDVLRDEKEFINLNAYFHEKNIYNAVAEMEDME